MASWTCPSCGRTRRTTFCAQCGEERLRPRDLTFVDLIARLARTLSSVDGKLFRSARAVLLTPGKLTASYVLGERRRFLGPLQLFLIANAFFFATQSLTGTNIFSSTLDSHLNVQDWRDLARSMVARRFGDDERALAAFASKFDKAAIFNAKALIILMVVVFAPLPALLFRKSRRPAGAHMVFALHLYAFVLVLFCASLLVAALQHILGGGGLDSAPVDTWLTVVNLVACSIYIYAAIHPAYCATGTSRTVCAAILALAVGVLLVGYRFAIFLITFYTT
jgi:hypothetical protein